MSNSTVPILAIILSLGFGLFYVKPEYTLAQERIANIAELARIVAKKDKINELIGGIDETLNTVKEDDRARFETFLPATADPIRFANNLQHFGLSHGVVFENIKVEEPTTVSRKGATQGVGTAVGGAVQGLVNVLTVVGKKEDVSTMATNVTNVTKVATDSSDKKFAITKASFAFTSTYEKFGGLMFDMERSLGLIKVVSLSFAPVESSSDTKKTKTVEQAPASYRFTFTVESYSLK